MLNGSCPSRNKSLLSQTYGLRRQPRRAAQAKNSFLTQNRPIWQHLGARRRRLRARTPPKGPPQPVSGGADDAWFAQNGAGGAEQRRSTKFAARVHATGCDAAIDLREGRGTKIYSVGTARVPGDGPNEKKIASLKSALGIAPRGRPARLSRERGRRAGSNSIPRERRLRSRRICGGSRSRPRCRATGLCR